MLGRLLYIQIGTLRFKYDHAGTSEDNGKRGKEKILMELSWVARAARSR